MIKDSDYIYKYRFLIALLVFILSLLIRIKGLASFEVEADEIHWVKRSAKIVEKFNKGEFTKLTTHIGHPGVVPALIMAFGQKLFNIGEDPKFLFGRSIDRLTISRLSCALFSSILGSLVFLLGASIIGNRSSLVAGLICGLCPTGIFLSRLAHLDSILTVLVFLSSYFIFKSEFYFFRDLNNSYNSISFRYKIFGAIFWGLALATKPTAMAVIAGLIFYRAFIFTVKRYQLKDFLRYDDFLALIVSHTVFALIFTRLWYHQSDYLKRLKIKSALADLIFTTGSFLHSYFLIFVGLIALTIWYLQRYNLSKSVKRFIYMLSGYMLTLAAFPQIWENIIRFWCWALGLKGLAHYAYGEVTKSPRFGYFEIFLSKIPDHIIIIVVVVLIYLLLQVIKNQGVYRLAFSERISKNLFFNSLVFFLTIGVLWGIMLSVSGKQTSRYLYPIFPLFYLTLSYLVLKIIDSKGKLFQLFASAYLVIPFCFYSFDISPYYGLFYSKITGGIEAAESRGGRLPIYGQKEVNDFLVSNINDDRTRLNIGLYGDIATYKYTLLRDHPSKADLVTYSYPRNHYSYDFIVASRNWVGDLHQIKSTDSQVLDFGVKDFNMQRVYSPNIEFNKTTSINFARVKLHNGRFDAQTKTVLLNPKEKVSKNGLVFSETFLVIKDSDTEVILRLLETVNNNTIKVSFGEEEEGCSNNNQNTGLEIRLACKNSSTKTKNLYVSWVGKDIATIKSIEIIHKK